MEMIKKVPGYDRFESVMLWVVLTVAGFAISAALTGCLGPAVLGLKSYTGSDGSRMDFITGADFNIGANGVDRVENQRGIQPSQNGGMIRASRKGE
jgi:hypothetical protein